MLAFVDENRAIRERDCINLNPAANVMNPRAEALPVFARDRGITTSHQFAIEAREFGGGQHMARRLRRARRLTCGIGLPIERVEADVSGLRRGTPDVVRWGRSATEMPQRARFIADVALERRAAESVAADLWYYGCADMHKTIRSSVFLPAPTSCRRSSRIPCRRFSWRFFAGRDLASGNF